MELIKTRAANEEAGLMLGMNAGEGGEDPLLNDCATSSGSVASSSGAAMDRSVIGDHSAVAQSEDNNCARLDGSGTGMNKEDGIEGDNTQAVVSGMLQAYGVSEQREKLFGAHACLH
ncbi:hypothetical protein HPP92_011973 [Vanilla planifolia]|uniref:Uncharacterized protein n=1 Tax=Vanilla planifolia TaxID=51239 RepID=A0A835R3T3_VANPL|nr:hypothetical protein HPP92_011973 [Vanilla planifolia]